MAVLSDDKEIQSKGIQNALRIEVPIVANDTVFGRALVGLNSGVARPLTAGDAFLGLAERRYDNEGGAASAMNVVLESGMLVKATISGSSSANLGAVVYATNDNLADVTLTKGSNSPIGTYEAPISGTSFWLKLFTPGEAAAYKALEARVTLNDAKVSA
jgi:hypothetical protein